MSLRVHIGEVSTTLDHGDVTQFPNSVDVITTGFTVQVNCNLTTNYLSGFVEGWVHGLTANNLRGFVEDWVHGLTANT